MNFQEKLPKKNVCSHCRKMAYPENRIILVCKGTGNAFLLVDLPVKDANRYGFFHKKCAFVYLTNREKPNSLRLRDIKVFDESWLEKFRNKDIKTRRIYRNSRQKSPTLA